MYISKVIIDNYRNFEHIEIPLNKLTILIGENYMLPLNMYEYKIISSNNGKGVRFDKLQNFNISYIGAVRDYDNQPKAKEKHDAYDNGINIFVRTTQGYTFENDLINQGNNKEVLENLFSDELNGKELEK